MARISSEDKQQRKELVWLTIQRAPQGITEAEIAAELHLERRTVNNYLSDLDREAKIYKDGLLWFLLQFERPRLLSFEVSPEEAITLYLATRLLVKQHDKRNEMAEAALLKLATALRSEVAAGKEIEQVARELAQRPVQSEYQSVFRTVVQGYTYRRKIRIRYKPLGGRPFETLFSTYLIEPSPIGFSTYLIGHSDLPNSLRAYKVERIESAEFTREEYQVPADFPGLALLHHAWNVIFGEAVVRVELRFSPDVRERVLETRWHPAQEEPWEDPDLPGYLRWAASVADTTDMVPWIRSWGAEAEVLAPAALKDAMRMDAIRLARLYEVLPETDPALARLLRCWGKAERGRSTFHPALFHMLDVGHVACELLSERASPRWRRVLADTLGVEASQLAQWLPWLIALHDIGKLSAAFQMLAEPQKARLLHEGFSFGQWRSTLDWHHTLIGQACLTEELAAPLGLTWPPALQNALGEVIGGHHGQFAHPARLPQVRRDLGLYEPPDWAALRLLAAQTLQAHLVQQLPEPWPQIRHLSAAVMSLTGFTILCDWLGSDNRFFPARPDLPLAEYAAESRVRAHQAVEMAGFFTRHQSTMPASFVALFPDCLPARPLQAALAEIPPDLLAGPCLAIIEAPTGEGKTETAETLAHQLAQASGSNDLYYALPTTATSNQMFGRVQRYVHERLGLSVQTRLVHGQAFLVEDDLRLELSSNAGQDASTEQTARAWFSPKKRAPLASVGVGTIDQVELAALNVRHSALRLLGLAGKVIILDEVHAYDTYMTTIVERLLQWLAALGSSVIVLSATLPAARRAALIRAYGLEPPDTQPQPYPSLWLGSRRGIFHATPPAYQPERELQVRTLHFAEDDAVGRAGWLLQAGRAGGCACWIASTVDRAQQMMRALQPLAQAEGIEVDLLHARLPLEERQRREQEIAAKYGPDGRRPMRGVVIGTQVLEQSLDLDFDVMVSDLAPIDLLLQRAGRLHRHQRARPAAHATPTLWINLILDSAGTLLGVERVLYAEYLLRQSWQVLAGRSVLHLPADYRTLVEAVYDDTPPPRDSPLWPAWQALLQQREIAEGEARLRLLPEPDPAWSFCARAARLTFEEDESRAAWIVAQTRLGAESLTVIPLERLDEETACLPDGQLVPLQRSAGRALPLRLLQRSIRLSHARAVRALRDTLPALPPLFTDSPLLRGTVPLWLTQGAATLTHERRTLDFMLDPVLGLVISSEGGAE